ncbi:MAG TPA: trypsin-like serine protease [Polyangia bacterium]|nr:trypsin-like serine protease [Polyangia bacterium]
MRCASLAKIGVGFCLLGCADATPDASNGFEHVVGGMPAAVCGFPMTAKIPGCTSTLLTPTILLTAKHCGPKAGMNVQFGEKTPYAFTVKTTKCVTAPDSDAAYCVLPDDDRLKKVPTVPPLHGCEYTKFMKAGATLMGVGWGQTKGTGPSGTKNQGEVPVVRVRDPFIDVGDTDSDLCFGDSGGGAYIHLVEGDKDWGWRVIGTVTGTARIPGGAPCGGTDYTTVLRHIKLIEQNEQIDVTPCTGQAGNFAPGPGCADLLTDIRTGGGTWPDCIAGPRTTLPVDSCAGAVTGTGGAGGVGGSGGRADGGVGTGGIKGDAGGDVAGAGGKSDAGGTGGRAGADASSAGTDTAADGSASGSTDGSTGGTVGTDAVVATGGFGGSVPSAGTGGGKGGAPGISPATTPTAGCGCHVGGRAGNRAAGVPLMLMAFVLVRRHRRSRLGATLESAR